MRCSKIISTLIIILLVPVVFLPTCISNTNHSSDKNLDSEIDTVLLTGFGPFNIYDVNPSQLIVEELNGEIIDGAEVIGLILPVDFSESVENITKAIDDYEPNIVISTGLSPRAKKINVEKIGINIKMYPRTEKLWFIPRLLERFGPLFRPSNLATKDIVSNINEAGIPSRQSFYAGFYICNAVLYGTLGYIKEKQLPIKSGFIHVPLLTSQDPGGMELNDMVDSIKIAIQTSLR